MPNFIPIHPYRSPKLAQGRPGINKMKGLPAVTTLAAEPSEPL